MALTSRMFVNDYELPTKAEVAENSPEFNVDSLDMFWQCSVCHASVLYLLDSCPQCVGKREKTK